MKLVWRFYLSDKREIYKQIAGDVQITSWMVYMLVEIGRIKECKALEELKKRGIVSCICP